MGFIAKDNGGGGDFKRIPPGAYIARCCRLIDLGTQTSDYQGQTKTSHRIRIVWEAFGDDEHGQPLIDNNGLPLTVSKNYSLSLHPKASLRKELASWRGKDFTEEEARAFDVSRLLGAYCMINVTENEGSNGKKYTNVASLTPVPAMLKNSKPAPGHPDQIFDLDKPDMNLFNSFHGALQDLIKLSPEWEVFAKSSNAQPTQQHAQAAPSDSGFSDMDEEIPFISCAFGHDLLTSKEKRMAAYDF